MIVSPTAKDKNEEEGEEVEVTDKAIGSGTNASGSQATAQVSLHSN